MYWFGCWPGSGLKPGLIPARAHHYDAYWRPSRKKRTNLVRFFLGAENALNFLMNNGRIEPLIGCSGLAPLPTGGVAEWMLLAQAR